MTVAAFDCRPAESRPPLAQPGRNCGRVVRAGRFGVVVDGDAYFRALKQALLAARHSILIVGWEFDSRTRLVRDGEDGHVPNEIGALLDHLVRSRPGLRVHVLIWDSAMIYAFNREFAGLVKMDWLTHRRLRFRLDDSHPLGASHHQKIVVIDDDLAFVGGLDVTSQRWDSRGHLPGDPRRSDPAYPVYPPFHDVMALVTGPAARALAEIGRQRWRQSSGEALVPPPVGDGAQAWPPQVPVLATDIDVAIARTCPAWDGDVPVREVEQLYLDMIAGARRLVYMENQYFAARRVADLLAERLERRDCPEIVLINPGEPVSMVERSTMGVARARTLRRLHQCDRFGRLHVYYPSVAGEDVKVHAKLMIVDDVALRIGSSNLNNRSMGLDSECDVLIEAGARAEVWNGIRALRHDLLGEHLGVPAAEVAAAEAACGTVAGVVAALGGRGHTLLPLDGREPAEIVQMLTDSGLPDPEEPVETLLCLDLSMPGSARRGLKLRVRAVAALLIAVALAGGALPWLGPAVQHDLAAALGEASGWAAGIASFPLVVAGFVVAGLLGLPVLPLVLVSGAVGGLWLGFALSLAGAMSSAVVLYTLGARLGRARVRRLAGWRVNRVNRALARHGIMAMLLLRLMPVASFPVVNLVAGAAAVRPGDFTAGTLVGMAPGIFALGMLGDRLAAVLRVPSPANAAVLGVAALLVLAAQVGVVSRLSRARAPLPGRST
jgi:phosphatidylserine/phosphatidylglycerophosphate/cardiolipin synthase-like enzyme/uncharacterized membrane protein YdjX (TVP38/TMEM64 family)